MSEPTIAVTLCFSHTARQICECVVHLKPGSRLLDALRESTSLSAILAKLPDAEVDALQTGVWGRKLAPDHVLRDGDRVELYRPLKVDPKLARRERFKGQGAGRTGLFARRRAGAKSGY